jgi:hypothetical protein
MNHYPHLLPDDVPVWERFLDTYLPTYNTIDYDVRVCPGYDPGPDWPENYRKMCWHLSCRRIDAVAFLTDRIFIIEITTSAGLTAIGQLTTYPTLYKNTYHPDLPCYPMLVAESLQNGIPDILKAQNIQYYLV